MITRILLVTLVFRAFIPIGFMPMFGPGYSVKLRLCEGYAALPSDPGSMSLDMASRMPVDMPAGVLMDMPMDASGAGGSRSPAHQDHSTCPYGASPTAAVLPPLNVFVPIVQVPAQQPSRFAQICYLKLSPRAQSSRGPPLEA